MRPEGAAPFRISDSGAWGLATQDPSWASGAWGLNYWETPPVAPESLAPGDSPDSTPSTPTSAENGGLPAGGYWISPRG